MKLSAVCLLALLLAGVGAQSQASHNWGGIDVCTVYRDTAPPGIDPAVLPEPDSRGAQLLQAYCVQCHELTGPGRHTAEEWPAVVERMRMLMDVSRRFRGLMGSVRMPDDAELKALNEYLGEHALQPLRGTPRGAGAEAFATACAACHSLPEPRQHNAAQWQAVVVQMQDKAGIMGRGDLIEVLASPDVLAWLQRNAADRLVADPHGSSGLAPVPALTKDKHVPAYGAERLLWLSPFFVMIGLGLWRWWARRQA